MENYFKNLLQRQEKLDIKVELARPEDWPLCKDLRLEALRSPDGKMSGLNPKELLRQEEAQSDQEWQEATSSENMFSVLAWNNLEAVGLGRARLGQDGIWNIRNGYVKPKFRVGGAGRKMFAVRLREIIRRNGKRALLGIKADNARSIHLAEGFDASMDSTFTTKLKKLSKLGWHKMEIDLTKPEVLKIIDETLNER